MYLGIMIEAGLVATFKKQLVTHVKKILKMSARMWGKIRETHWAAFTTNNHNRPKEVDPSSKPTLF